MWRDCESDEGERYSSCSCEHMLSDHLAVFANQQRVTRSELQLSGNPPGNPPVGPESGKARPAEYRGGAVWKEADVDLLILREARQEYDVAAKW
jgi:hypothetical protein